MQTGWPAVPSCYSDGALAALHNYCSGLLHINKRCWELCQIHYLDFHIHLQGGSHILHGPTHHKGHIALPYFEQYMVAYNVDSPHREASLSWCL